MKRLSGLFILIAATGLIAGCSGAFWGGTAGGTAATGAAYELRARQQMDKIEDQKNRGEIDEREYQIRKDQVRQMSVAY